jgi:hypothetical protein
MNHALICKNYYGTTKENLYPLYPEIKRFEMYFNAVKARDSYYNAMKYHAIHIIKDLVPELTLKKIGNIVDLDHATVLHYLKKYIPITGHNEFISKNFERFIENQIYPLKPKNHKDIKRYGAFKPTTLEEARQYSKPNGEGKKKEKEKRTYTSSKNPAEKY